MKRRVAVLIIAVVGLIGFLVVTDPASSAPAKRFTSKLSGFQEVPAISSPGKGSITLTLTPAGTLRYKLTYSGTPTAVTQSHIHFGQPGVNGGIVAFFCTNLGNGPAGTPACPPSPGTVSGVIAAATVVGPSSQGIAASEFSELIAAMRGGVTYANVHTTAFPGGEIRGRLKPVS